MIDKHARKKLKDKISKVGLIGPLIWNKKTGNLVGGHQRLSILDELEGRQDYSLTVAVCDLTEKQEKDMNVFLNNQSAMGSFDFDALESLAKESGATAADFGFDPTEFKDIVGEPIFGGESQAVQRDVEYINGLKQAKREGRKRARAKDDPEFYFVVVGQTRQEVTDFLVAAGLPGDERYVDLKRLADSVGIQPQTSAVVPELERAQSA